MTTKELLEAIVNHDKDQIYNLLTNSIDINSKEDQVTPLWVAITGSSTIKNNPIKKGSHDIIDILLSNGADPNLQCVLTPPLYVALVEEDMDIVMRLLNGGAYPDDYKVDNLTNQGVNNCKLPIMYAIENTHLSAVEALLSFDCIFNKETIRRAKKMVDIKNKNYREINNYNNSKSCSEEYYEYREAQYIVKMLEDAYNEYVHESRASKYIAENKLGYNSKMNFFIGLESV